MPTNKYEGHIEIKAGEICLQIGNYYICTVLDEHGNLADSVCQGHPYIVEMRSNGLIYTTDTAFQPEYNYHIIKGMEMIHFGVFKCTNHAGPDGWKYLLSPITKQQNDEIGKDIRERNHGRM